MSCENYATFMNWNTNTLNHLISISKLLCTEILNLKTLTTILYITLKSGNLFTYLLSVFAQIYLYSKLTLRKIAFSPSFTKHCNQAVSTPDNSHVTAPIPRLYPM